MHKIISPLAEKRFILFTVKKEMIGRRAYSDSVRMKKPSLLQNRKNGALSGGQTLAKQNTAAAEGGSESPTSSASSSTCFAE
jgi:hypothetical protein